jgi:hypothetical protein
VLGIFGGQFDSEYKKQKTAFSLFSIFFIFYFIQDKKTPPEFIIPLEKPRSSSFTPASVPRTQDSTLQTLSKNKKRKMRRYGVPGLIFLYVVYFIFFEGPVVQEPKNEISEEVQEGEQKVYINSQNKIVTPLLKEFEEFFFFFILIV